jgi:hypothetical protein
MDITRMLEEVRVGSANLMPWPGPQTTLRISTSVVPVCSDIQSSPVSQDELICVTST